MVNDICDKSEGLFLWVHLVTKSVLYGLSDGEHPHDLLKLLGELLNDLEEMFLMILSGFNPSHSKRRPRLF
jgi:hypothetical protein